MSAAKNALISVSDKNGLSEFARRLAAAKFNIFSTGGTRKHLEEAGLKVRDIAEYTGFPEMMDGRVKTLHPKVFGGILCRRDNPEDMVSVDEHGMVPFDLVVVNLYPFESTIAREGVTPEEAIEQIDIGGPSLVRAAAKNHAFTAIATSPDQYDEILQEVEANGAISLELRRRLAAAAFAHTATYDTAIAAWFAEQTAAMTPEVPTEGNGELPATWSLRLRRKTSLRYGENPHQSAAVYEVAGQDTAHTLLTAKQLNGKELSYNNLLDLDSALAIVRGWNEPAASVIKHNNPCGAASNGDLAQAARNALDGDPVSAFGSVLAFNRMVDVATAEVLAEPGRFIEAIAAPSFEPGALEILTTRPKWKANVRLLELGQVADLAPSVQLRAIEGGYLAQLADTQADDPSEWKVVTSQPIDPALEGELRFAWHLVRFVKSNAIVVAKDQSLLGAGAGQMSRVDSVRIAIEKAGDRISGAVLASDAFFPFPDSIELAAATGIKAVIQPGGSVRDEEVITACNQHGIAMVFTGRRHFRH